MKSNIFYVKIMNLEPEVLDKNHLWLLHQDHPYIGYALVLLLVIYNQ